MGVPKIAVELENVGVVDGGLDKDLSFDLLAEVVVFEFGFVHFLEGHDQVGAPLPGD